MINNKIKPFNGIFNKDENWGMMCSINLYECDPQKIRSKVYITGFAKQICKVINMNAYGNPLVVDFGQEDRVTGYTLIQLIETSNIVAHFANTTNAVYLDIFSCKEFSDKNAVIFAKQYFNAKKYEYSTMLR